MTPATATAPTDDEPVGPLLTWQEICACYPDEWVVLVDLEGADAPHGEWRRARVVAHDASRKVAYAAGATALRHARVAASRFTGRVRAPLIPHRWL